MWFMTFRIALRALARNKLRSFLTMLGIIIGVGAVIAMVAIGEGAKATIRSQIASLGTNVLIILPGTTSQGGVRVGFGSVNTLTDGDVRAIREEIRSVAFASPVLRRPEQVVAGNLNLARSRKALPPSINTYATGRLSRDVSFMMVTSKTTPRWPCWVKTVVKNLFGNDDRSIPRTAFATFLFASSGYSGEGTEQPGIGSG